MPVISNTGTVTPSGSVEQDVVSITPGQPLDNLSVYVVGGTGGTGPLEFALYATVGGFRTRVAQAKFMGTNTPSLIDWQTGVGPLSGGSGGNGLTELIDAGGTAYTITVIDLSANTGTRNAVTVTIAAVNTFDTAPDGNFGQIFSLAPGATGTLTVFPGYAQLMDVAIDQTNLPPVTVTVTADCGIAPLSVLGTIVDSVQMTGKDETVAAVFRGLQLPVATRYFVSVTNNSRNSLSVTLTGVTYSVAVTAGGAVILMPDVIGASNANEVVAWAHQPLQLFGSTPPFISNFMTPLNAAIPIYDFALGEWRAVVINGGGTVDENGVLTVTVASVVLAGDVTGPSSPNNEVVKWAHVPLSLVGGPGTGNFAAPGVDAAVPIYNAGLNEWFAFAFTGDVTLSDAGATKVIAWENVPLDPVSMGAPAIGSIPVFTANVPNHWVATAPGAIVITLTGNVNGPSNANLWTSFIIPAANIDVPIPTNEGWYYVGVSALTALHTVTLPVAPTAGEVVVVTDEDGSLGAPTLQTFNVDGAGKLVEGVAIFSLDNTYPGAFGSVCFQYDGTAWFIFADYDKNAAGALVLAGNTNGPSGANVLNSFTIENVSNTDVLAGAFVPANGEWYVGIIGIPVLGGTITVNIPVMPTGSKVTVKDEDGSLANGNIVLMPAGGKTIDGAASYTMTAVQNGVNGSVTIIMNGRAPTEWQLI